MDVSFLPSVVVRTIGAPLRFGGPLALRAAIVYIQRLVNRYKSHCIYMEKRIKTAQVNFRIDPRLKAEAEKAAADDQRSLTSLIEKLLTDYLKKRVTK